MGIVSAMMQVGAAIKHAVAALFTVDYSLRFDGSGDYLSRSQDVPTEPEKWTWAGWVKLSTSSTAQQNLLGAGSSGNQGHLQLFNNRFGVRKFTSVEDFAAYTSSTYTDTAVWTHFVLAYDSTFGPAFADDRVKIWVNGQLENTLVNYSGGSASYPDQNETVSLNAQSVSQYISRRAHSAAYYFNGQLAEVHFVDGQALPASDFGETRNGQWVPKEVTGVTYGNNGFYLPFDRRTEGVAVLLTGDDISIADASTNTDSNVQVGTSAGRSTSVYKNGSGSLEFSRSAGISSYVKYDGLAIGQGDYTVEFWWKPTALNQTPGTDDESLWDLRAGNTSFPFIFYTPINNVPQIVLLEGGAYRIQSTVTLSHSTWYHVALVRNAGVSEMFINGASQGTWSPTSATTITATTHWIGRRYQAYLSAYYGLDGHIDDFRLTVGIARDIAADWAAGVYTSPLTNDIQYGSLGRDATTNGNDFAVNGNITPDDQLLDTPNLRFAALDPSTAPSGTTLSNGNLTVDHGATYGNIYTDQTITAGKYYCEVRADATTNLMVTVTDTSGNRLAGYWRDGNKYNGGASAYASAFSSLTNPIIGVALNADTGTVWFSLNGVWQKSANPDNFADATDTNYAFSSLTGPFKFGVNDGYSSDVNSVTTHNFGQDHTFAGSLSPLTSPYTDDDGNGEFRYQPPPGFKALATSY